MASSPSYGDRPPLQGFRRSFTTPHRQPSYHERASQSDADAGSELLYTHPSVRIISFSPPPPETVVSKTNQISKDADYPIDTVETLPWRSRTEDLVASGRLIIEKVRGSVWFFKCGTSFTFAVLRNSQCWCVDGESKFVWRKGKFQYYRLELPTSTPEQQEKVEELKEALCKVLKFEKTPCPFKRGFHVDLPEDAITPRRKGKWKPKEGSLPNTPDTDTPPLPRTKNSRSWSLHGQSPLPVPESRRASDMGFAQRLYPLGTRRDRTSGLRSSTPSSVISSEEGTSYGQPEYSDGTSNSDDHDFFPEDEYISQEKPESPMPQKVETRPRRVEEARRIFDRPPNAFETRRAPSERRTRSIALETFRPMMADTRRSESASRAFNTFDLSARKEPEWNSSQQESELLSPTTRREQDWGEDGMKTASEHAADPSATELPASPPESVDYDQRQEASLPDFGTSTTNNMLEAPEAEEDLTESGVIENKGLFSQLLAELQFEACLSPPSNPIQPLDPVPNLRPLDAEAPQLESDVKAESVPELKDTQKEAEPAIEVLPVEESLDDSASVVSTADSFHTTTSEDMSYPKPHHATELLQSPDGLTTSRFQHKRGVSEMTVTASNFGEDDDVERPNTPRLIKSSASDDSWPDVVTPANVQEGLRQRLKSRRSLSPMPPSSTVYVPRSTPRNTHMTSVVLQKAVNLALVKPIEVVALVVHVLARIAGGASLNDLLTGELFRRPEQHRRNSSFPDRLSPHHDDDEDDFGVPIRGRTRSAETDATKEERDTDADSMFDLD
jgi:hypothetical protein